MKIRAGTEYEFNYLWIDREKANNLLRKLYKKMATDLGVYVRKIILIINFVLKKNKTMIPEIFYI